MNYFPSVETFNMNSVDGRALYLAHCDLDPIRALIIHTRIALNATIEYFGDEAQKAGSSGDLYAESNAMDIQSIFASQVASLNYEAVLLILVSRLEEALNTWCRCVHLKNSYSPELKDYSPDRRYGALEKAANYLKAYAGGYSIKSDRAWETITAIRDTRNIIIHNGGRVKAELRPKLEKHRIEMREEDHSVYMDYDTLMWAYEEILQFCDRVYNIRGQAFPEKQ